MPLLRGSVLQVDDPEIFRPLPHATVRLIVLRQDGMCGGAAFARVIGSANKLGIELDGHAFHERTPAQVARDKQRERALIRHGFTILRFTGTEMVRNPRKCLDEVSDLIAQKIA